MLRVSSLLDAWSHVLSSTVAHVRTVQSRFDEALDQLIHCRHQIQQHRRRMCNVMYRSSGTEKLASTAISKAWRLANCIQLWQILEFRSNEGSSLEGRDIKSHINVANSIASRTHVTQADLATTVKAGQQNSNTVTALTLIATMYLPASLLAVWAHLKILLAEPAC
jgi:hypothetical protein